MTDQATEAAAPPWRRLARGMRRVVRQLPTQPPSFMVAPSASEVALTIRAQAAALWRLVRGQDDADRLFFERALVMEGDTEYGVALKNVLDAVGPLLPARLV